MRPETIRHSVWFAAVLAGFPFAELQAGPLTVHEWGTFTSVSGSDGALLPGLEREEQQLPPFVYSHAGFSPANKGWSRPVANVTIKMETPVIYFYSDEPRSVTVDVKFHGGSISQWYPQRSGGEAMSGVATRLAGLPAAEELDKAIPVNFAKSYQGSASWRIDVLAPDAGDTFSTVREWETPQMLRSFSSIPHWLRARVPGANKIRGTDPKREVEGFIFYRGIGNFPLPFSAKCEGGSLVLGNSGAAAIPFLFVYEKRAAFPDGVAWWSGSLEAGKSQRVPLLKSFGDVSAALVLEREFPRQLERAGLTAAEAKALIATWRESYFERDGLRVFWIVPREFTDAVLPISIAPRPEKLERVLVGRSEVLTPSFEAELKREFAANRGQRWMQDRYYAAYQARAQQLGVVLPPVLVQKTSP